MRGHRGFLSVNDGVATAEGIARLVDHFIELDGSGFLDPHPNMVPMPMSEAFRAFHRSVGTPWQTDS